MWRPLFLRSEQQSSCLNGFTSRDVIIDQSCLFVWQFLQRSLPYRFVISGLVLGLIVGAPAAAEDVVRFEKTGTEQLIKGRVLVRAQDGGLLLLGRDGQIWPIPSTKLIEHREQIGTPFVPYKSKQLGEKIQEEFGSEFRILRTRHYVICFNTSREFAKWCGGLFERLYRRFTNYWTKRDFPVSEPEFPLPVLIFADYRSYAQAATADLQDALGEIPGYYSFETNRVTLRDMTATTRRLRGKQRRNVSKQIREIMSSDDGLATIATIIHEATHQVAFNCGLHRRYADNPLWLTEGMAIYFEVPDPASRDGWARLGALHPLRLRQFRDYVRSRRSAHSLRDLVRSDQRLRDVALAPDAYAESWALTYFLIQKHAEQYQNYLAGLRNKVPLIQDSPEQRMAFFEQLFGRVDRIDAEMIEYFSGLR